MTKFRLVLGVVASMITFSLAIALIAVRNPHIVNDVAKLPWWAIIGVAMLSVLVVQIMADQLDAALAGKRRMLRVIRDTYDTLTAWTVPEHPRFGSVDSGEVDDRLEDMHRILKSEGELPIDRPPPHSVAHDHGKDYD